MKGDRYSCTQCGKSYATSSNLSRHKQTHRPIDSSYAKRCPDCGKVYVSMPALRYWKNTELMLHLYSVFHSQLPTFESKYLKIELSKFNENFISHRRWSNLDIYKISSLDNHWLLTNGQKRCFCTFPKVKFASNSASTRRFTEIFYMNVSHIPFNITTESPPRSMDICYFTSWNAEPKCNTRPTATTGRFSFKLSRMLAHTLLYITRKYQLLLTLSCLCIIILTKNPHFIVHFYLIDFRGKIKFLGKMIV
jgi:hypothetical protein